MALAISIAQHRRLQRVERRQGKLGVLMMVCRSSARLCMCFIANSKEPRCVFLGEEEDISDSEDSSNDGVEEGEQKLEVPPPDLDSMIMGAFEGKKIGTQPAQVTMTSQKAKGKGKKGKKGKKSKPRVLQPGRELPQDLNDMFDGT